MAMAAILGALAFITCLLTTSANACPSSSCGNLTINYPFKLQDTQTDNNCSYFNLSCTSDGFATLALPHAGSFYVRFIGTSFIQLFDPGNCLMARLMQNLDFSDSPFDAIGYENYTFYTCPSDDYILNKYIYPIDCLSNSTDSTIASAYFLPEELIGTGCQVIGSHMLPVMFQRQFEFGGIFSDLYLTWNDRVCSACEMPNEQPSDGVKNSPIGDGDGSNGKTWAKFSTSPFLFPALIAMSIVVGVCAMMARKMAASSRNDGILDFPSGEDGQPSPAAARGLDESKINACTELVVLRTNPEEFNACSICLEGYCPEEQLRSIAKCQHSFHAQCIEQWLSKSTTCPVCRTILSDLHS
ncbi:RING-H2 finger protein ATL22-like [Andrographis paniculata]|uniref:RING-H2 finger protein ATL22-like n=1 Tax=Andrographis paniculata TaxID=175694 RepID=UPI0021E8CFD0|nr:RING-H2 finger protein ATL22-like [Andrographis paniculata]